MFERFELKKNENENLRIEGYLWPVKDAKYVFCIVHGTGEYSERYDRMAKYLNGREIAVISMDLRGHGRSTGKGRPVTMDAHPRTANVFASGVSAHQQSAVRPHAKAAA